VFLQQLKILEGYDLAKMGHNSADYIHTVIETAKLAFADRDAYYGDPRFVQVPFDRLLSENYAAERRKLIDLTVASMEIRPGGGAPTVFKNRLGLSPGLDDTTHLDAIDNEGNMVAATPSGGWINMSPIIPGLGFSLGVRGQMFWLDARHPGCLQPGKRPRTTITPSLVMKDSKPLMVFGTLGGDNQDQWTLQFFLNYVNFGMNLQEAIDEASFDTAHFYSSWSGHKATPGVMNVENRIDPAIVEELRRRGHKVTVQKSGWTNGRVLAAEIDHVHGTLRAAASPRAETGYAIGW
jgi:gamma-glutamyltranspeptidase / glutathione hydrolase